MAEYSRFFDHIEGDRTYNAADWAEYFRQILTTGVLEVGDNLKVYVNGTDRIARVKPGKAWIEGYFYKLTEEMELPLEEAHGTYDRIDRIVLRLDTSTEVRGIHLEVLSGEPTLEPVAPTITRAGNIYEISLAQILVIHNTTSVPVANVTDERTDNTVCGVTNLALDYGEFATKADLGDINATTIPAEIRGLPITEQITKLFTSVSNGKNLVRGAITDTDSSIILPSDPTFQELANAILSIVTDPSVGTTDAVASDILLGKKAVSEGVLLTGTMPNRGAVTRTITTQGGSYTIPEGYHNGAGKVTANFANLVASNIKKGVNIGGVVGTLKEAVYGNKTVSFKDLSFSDFTVNLGFKPVYVALWMFFPAKSYDGMLVDCMLDNDFGESLFVTLEHDGDSSRFADYGYSRLIINSTGFTVPGYTFSYTTGAPSTVLFHYIAVPY